MTARAAAAPAALHVAVLGRDGAAAIADEWRGLAGRVIEANVFHGPDFLLPQLAAFAPAAAILALRDGIGGLVGVAALAPIRLGFGVAGRIPAIWCNDYAPLGTPLVDAGVAVPVWRAILDHVAADHAALAIPAMRLDGPAFAALQTAAAAAGRGLEIVGARQRAALGREDAGEAISARRRKEYQRQWRRLGERGRLVADGITEPAAVRDAFEAFLALEAAGWKGRAGTAMAGIPPVAAFARTAIAGLAARGQVVVDRIALDGRPVALLVRLGCGDTAWPWKIAYDEDLAAFSPGVQVMLQATARLRAEPGFRLGDSLAVADHPMIDHLWRDRIAIGTVIVDLGGAGLKARLAAADLRSWLALKRAAKAARDGLARALAQRTRSRRDGPAGGPEPKAASDGP